MKTKHTENKLLYIEEYSLCPNHLFSAKTGFKLVEFNENLEFEEKSVDKNYLLFFLKGDFIIHCNQFHDRLFHAEDMILIPRSSQLRGVTTSGSTLLLMFFDLPEESCDKQALESLTSLCEEVEYNFEPVKMRHPLTPFVEILTCCIENEVNHTQLHDLMQREFFLLLRGFYKKQEIATLFYPIIGKEMDFKDFIMHHYSKVSSIEQLILLSNWGRSRFFTKFQEVFGMTAKQWMLKQRDEQILQKMSEPGICIKDVLEELGFESHVYFSRYCKHHFGCTPKQLMKRSQIGIRGN